MSENNLYNQEKKKYSNKGKAKVTILGETYMIKSKESRDYINDIASFVDNHLSEIKDKNCTMPRNRLVLLGLMNLADELYKNQEEKEVLEKKVKRLNNKNDKLEIKYENLKDEYQELKEEYNEFLDLIDEEGGLDD